MFDVFDGLCLLNELQVTSMLFFRLYTVLLFEIVPAYLIEAKPHMLEFWIRMC